MPGRDTSYGYSVYSRTMAVPIRILFREEKVRGGTMGRPLFRIALPRVNEPQFSIYQTFRKSRLLSPRVHSNIFLSPSPPRKRISKQDEEDDVYHFLPFFFFFFFSILSSYLYYLFFPFFDNKEEERSRMHIHRIDRVRGSKLKRMPGEGNNRTGPCISTRAGGMDPWHGWTGTEIK